MPDGNNVEFGRIANDVDQSLHFGLVSQTHAEQFDGRVVDVVVGCNHAQIQRSHIHAIYNVDALKQYFSFCFHLYSN